MAPPLRLRGLTGARCLLASGAVLCLAATDAPPSDRIAADWKAWRREGGRPGHGPLPPVGSVCGTEVSEGASQAASTMEAIEALYEGLRDRMGKNSSDEELMNGIASEEAGPSEKSPCKANGEATYGEITVKGLSRALTDKLVAWRGAEEHFVDLGAGLGKLAVAAATIHGAGRAVGVELAGRRHEAACSALGRLSNASAAAAGSGAIKAEGALEMRLEDLLVTPAVDSATVVLLGSLCFRTSFMRRIGARLGERLAAGARVLTMNKLPEAGTRFRHLGAIKLDYQEVSWYTGGTLQVYVAEEASAEPRGGGRGAEL